MTTVTKEQWTQLKKGSPSEVARDLVYIRAGLTEPDRRGHRWHVDELVFNGEVIAIRHPGQPSLEPLLNPMRHALARLIEDIREGRR